jgi:hypothetical protein
VNSLAFDANIFNSCNSCLGCENQLSIRSFSK